MITYKFRCPKCGREYDIDIPMDQYDYYKDKETCPHDSAKLERVIEFSGLAKSPGYGIDNGGGWHV